MDSLFREIRSVFSWFDLLYLNEPYQKWVVYFLALTQSVIQLHELRNKLALSKKVFDILVLCRGEGEKALHILNRFPKMKRSEIYRVLSPLPSEILLFLMAKTNQESTRKAISLYFTQLKSIRVNLGGQDLIELGLTPGPLFKTILMELLEARLNGEVLTREDEVVWVSQRYVNPAINTGADRQVIPLKVVPGKGKKN
jgi:tRNA nucleotidyltransferase (CCA-adding enzyme)